MRFERLSERVNQVVARPWFTVIVVLAIVAWIPTLWLFDTGTSDLIVDAVANPLSLLLLVLLHNSQYRSGATKDSRQDQMEKSLALLLEEEAGRADSSERRDRLREAADQLVANAEEATRISAGDARQ